MKQRAATERIKEAGLQILWQAAVIVLSAGFIGVVFNKVHPEGLPLVADWSPEARLTADSGESLVVSLEEARVLCSTEKAVFLDARSPELYAQGHIRCARNLPWQDFERFMERIVSEIPLDVQIVTYCDGEHCSLSEDLARELLAMGYERVWVLLNGWTRWLEAGFPTEKTPSGYFGERDIHLRNVCPET